jgi:hypothetical protein
MTLRYTLLAALLLTLTVLPSASAQRYAEPEVLRFVPHGLPQCDRDGRCWQVWRDTVGGGCYVERSTPGSIWAVKDQRACQ